MTTSPKGRTLIEERLTAAGWNVTPDDTINFDEFAAQYEANPELWDALFKYMATTDLAALSAGKHEIIPGRVWVNLLEYTPKDAASTKIESHENFIDLQYTFVGDELMGLAGAVTPTGPYDPVKDKTNYSTTEPISYVPAGADRFFLYFPADMHQPSVAATEPAVPSRKIVGKIEYKK